GVRPTPSYPSQTAFVARCGSLSAQPVTGSKAAAEPAQSSWHTGRGTGAVITGTPSGSLAEHVASALVSGQLPRTAGVGLPLAPLALPTPTPSLYYTVTPVDARGRLADRSPIRALGWQPGQPITITLLQQAIVVTAQAGAADAITGQGHLRLPARIRHRCH